MKILKTSRFSIDASSDLPLNNHHPFSFQLDHISSSHHHLLPVLGPQPESKRSPPPIRSRSGPSALFSVPVLAPPRPPTGCCYSNYPQGQLSQSILLPTLAVAPLCLVTKFFSISFKSLYNSAFTAFPFLPPTLPVTHLNSNRNSSSLGFPTTFPSVKIPETVQIKTRSVK